MSPLPHHPTGPFPALRSGNALAHLYPSAERLDPVLLRFDRAYRLVRDNDVRDAFRLATTALEELPAAHRTGMVRAYAPGLPRQRADCQAAQRGRPGVRDGYAGETSFGVCLVDQLVVSRRSRASSRSGKPWRGSRRATAHGNFYPAISPGQPDLGRTPHGLGHPARHSSAAALEWIRDFTQFHSSHHAAGLYTRTSFGQWSAGNAGPRSVVVWPLKVRRN